jgi:DNA polymerase
MTTVTEKLEYLRVVKIGDCKRCKLHLNRTNVVFGEGATDAHLMFVGEAPGAEEDRTGRPFVGRAGQLLDEWIAALGLQRRDVYIANVCKCRPLDNRDPFPQEKAACAPFLHTQIYLVRPRLLVALGRHAANTLAGQELSMAELRESRLVYNNAATGMRVPVVAVFHPSYVLRTGRGKAEAAVLGDLRKALSGLEGTPKTAPTPRSTTS